MGKKANPALIGAFVVGAVALAVAGILVFGSGQLFKHTIRFVCFFSGAVDGLNVGAPVKFKGVEVGSVADIRLRLTDQSVADPSAIQKGIRIPVIMELDSDKMVGRGTKRMGAPEVKQLVDLGLRAQLKSQSLVTGLLFVQLDFVPDVPATFVLPPGSEFLEVPTIPTTMERVESAAQQIIEKLEDINFDALVKSATETMEAINGIVSSPSLKRTVEALPDTVANVNQAVASLRELTARLESKEGPLLDSIKRTSDSAGEALGQARLSMQSMQEVLDPKSVLASQLTASLQEIASAARSVRLLADYLERNPSAVVRGKDTTTP